MYDIKDIQGFDEKRDINTHVKIDKKDLERLKPLNNFVLIKTIADVEKLKTPSGIYLVSPNAKIWDEARHANRIGLVVSTPDILTYKSKTNKYAMDWDTDMELKVGDVVWYSYFDDLNCQWYICEGEEYKLIPYGNCYVAKREYRGDVDTICLNGYILCEDVYAKPVSDLQVKTKIDNRLGKVAYVGNRNKEYKIYKYNDCADVNVGDIIIKRDKRVRILLEDEYYASFDDKKIFWVIQRKDIMGIMSQEYYNNNYSKCENNK